MVKGWTIVSVRRARGLTLHTDHKPYRIHTKHINGHEETYVIEAVDELHAWQEITDWIEKNYEA